MADQGIIAHPEMTEEHPGICSETSITIYLQDDLLHGVNEVYCRGLTSEGVLAGLEMAVRSVREFIDMKKAGGDEQGEGSGG